MLTNLRLIFAILALIFLSSALILKEKDLSMLGFLFLILSGVIGLIEINNKKNSKEGWINFF